MQPIFQRWLIAILALGSVPTYVGCGGADPTSRLTELNETNLQRVTNLYLAYQAKNNFLGPRDEQALQSFVRSVPANKLERIGIDPSGIDGLFISDRDGQPFKIRYGVQGNMMGSQEPVVFEAEGQNGKRLVGFLDMTQREVDAAEYEQLWANGAGTPAGGQRG